MKWEYVAGCLILILFTLIFIVANLSFFLFLLKILISIIVLLLLLGLIINFLNPVLFKKYKEFLLSILSFFNTCLGKIIFFALSYYETPELVREISTFTIKSKNKQLNSIILKLLSGITKQSCIDEVCKIWANTRHRDLENLLVKKGWVASAPLYVRVLSALKVNQLDLILNSSEEIIEPLLNAIQDKDSEIADQASECALLLTNPDDIDYICYKWAETRDKLLEQLVCKGKYIAQQPIELRVLTALKVAKLEVIRDGGREIVEPLLSAFQDKDSDIANRASEYAISLTNTEAIDYICRLAIEPDHQVTHQIAIKAQYAPRKPDQRALFYFLTEQWDKYENLDYEHSLLQKVYELGDEKLRKRIADKAKQTGHVAWVEIVAGGRKGQQLKKMTDAEWEITLAVLHSGKQWEEMWRLAQKAPAVWSKQLLQQLNEVAWLPKAEQEKRSFGKLKDLADKCLDKIQPIGGLMQCKKTFTHPAQDIIGISFSPDGELLADLHSEWLTQKPGSTISVRRIPYSHRVNLNKFDKLPFRNGGISFSPDGELLAYYTCNKAIIRLWQMSDKQSLPALGGHRGKVTGISFSPDGQMLASCSEDGTIKLWQMPDGQLLHSFNNVVEYCDGSFSSSGFEVKGIIFSPDGKLLASLDERWEVKLWQIPDGQLLHSFKETVTGITFSPDGKTLVGICSGEIILWQIPDGKHLAKFNSSTNFIKGITLSPDGKILAGFCSDEITLWQISDGKHLASFNNSTNTNFIKGITFSPDGKILASFGNEEIKLWSSDLLRLTNYPIEQLHKQDREFLETTLKNDKVTQEEKHWLEFMQALMNWHKRFDVEVEDAPQLVSTGEFDIEIEG